MTSFNQNLFHPPVILNSFHDPVFLNLFQELPDHNLPSTIVLSKAALVSKIMVSLVFSESRSRLRNSLCDTAKIIALYLSFVTSFCIRSIPYSPFTCSLSA